jgi:hypothetical protein
MRPARAWFEYGIIQPVESTKSHRSAGVPPAESTIRWIAKEDAQRLRSKSLTQNSARITDFATSSIGRCLTNTGRKPNIKIYLFDFLIPQTC